MPNAAARGTAIALALLATAALAGCGAPRSLLDPYRCYMPPHSDRPPRPEYREVDFVDRPFFGRIQDDKSGGATPLILML